MHLMKKAIVNSNSVSIGGHGVKKGVADILKGINLVSSIVVFNIVCFSHYIRPETSVSVFTQQIFLVSQEQLFQGKNVKVVIDDYIIKVVGNLESAIKTSGPFIINGDWSCVFTCELAHGSSNSPKKFDLFVDGCQW